MGFSANNRPSQLSVRVKEGETFWSWVLASVVRIVLLDEQIELSPI